eukprot:NODE_5037_length_608_cov_28.432916_g4346_i0.p2 GENE.NODE_5037_length_608_cov_28.432916_g4346_i0~~NODE_5037_length_608_cov_28.432916_g4346_i0.p2  ORF type:complete len:60 (-),score=2.32 NODE_5037_length_608_cov_28.432916_g4346_i0:315-494(-)
MGTLLIISRIHANNNHDTNIFLRLVRPNTQADQFCVRAEESLSLEITRSMRGAHCCYHR